MERIKSFTVNHNTLVPGVYESRRDPVGNSVVVTYDIRLIKPNVLPVLNNPQHSYVIIPHIKTESFISARWDAAPDFIC
jgi:S-ribosylhomocysteine lyase LuxS involved in autoinducer biosynthesis